MKLRIGESESATYEFGGNTIKVKYSLDKDEPKLLALVDRIMASKDERRVSDLRDIMSEYIDLFVTAIDDVKASSSKKISDVLGFDDKQKLFEFLQNKTGELTGLLLDEEKN